MSAIFDRLDELFASYADITQNRTIEFEKEYNDWNEYVVGRYSLDLENDYSLYYSVEKTPRKVSLDLSSTYFLVEKKGNRVFLDGEYPWLDELYQIYSKTTYSISENISQTMKYITYMLDNFDYGNEYQGIKDYTLSSIDQTIRLDDREEVIDYSIKESSLSIFFYSRSDE